MHGPENRSPTPSVPRSRATFIWCAVTLVTAAAPLVATLAAGYTLVTRDTARMFEPLRPLVVTALRTGRLPLWNPYEALGIPLFAQIQHGALHPVSLLAAFLLPSVGLDLFIVVHVLLAAGGAFALARQLDASPGGAAVAGIGYGLSGYVLSMSCNLPYLAAAGTAPWALAALRAAGRGSRFGVVVGPLAIAALLFAGDPQWTVVTAALAGVLAFEAGGLRGLARASVAMAVGALLAAVQLLPTWAYLQETSRVEGLSSVERSQWALAPWRILEFLIPGFFGGRPGSGVAQVFIALGGPTTYGAPFVPSVHLGVGLVALAAIACRSSAAAKVLAASVIALLWLALGVHLGADQLLRAVPLWGAFRYSEKLVGPLTLCLSVLAGLGADRLGSIERRLWIKGALACAAAAVLVLLALGLGDHAGSMLRERLQVGLAHLLAGLLLLLAILFALVRPRLRDLAQVLAAGLVLVPAVAASPFALHAGTADIRERDPLRAVRAAGEVTRIATPTRKGAAYGPAAFDDADKSVYLESRMGVMPYGAPAGVDHMGPYSPLWPVRYERVFFAFLRDFGPQRWIAWRRFAVNRIVVDTRQLPDVHQEALAALDGAQKLQSDTGLGFSVWEVPHRRWAGFATGVIPVASEQEAYQRLCDAMTAGSQDVVIENSPPLPAAPGRVLGFTRGPNEVHIEAESGANGVLVVNDTSLPGWTATIDGVPTRILRADVLVRAVVWPAGRHVLEMRYEPAEVRIGSWMTAAGALALLAFGAMAFRNRGNPPGRAQP